MEGTPMSIPTHANDAGGPARYRRYLGADVAMPTGVTDSNPGNNTRNPNYNYAVWFTY